MHSTNYNFIAPFYKRLSRLVFGQGLENATAHYLHKIGGRQKVLIIGGGNGELLKSLYKVCPSAEVTYCELSSKMIGLANKKNPFPMEQTTFIQKDAFTLNGFEYDWIVLPFFLDQFEVERCISFLKNIKVKSKSGTKIMFSDMNEEGISKALLSTMYLFFRVTTGLKNNKLPDFDRVFEESRWKKEAEEIFSKGRVVTRVYY